MARKNRHIADFDEVANVEITTSEPVEDKKVPQPEFKEVRVMKDETAHAEPEVSPTPTVEESANKAVQTNKKFSPIEEESPSDENVDVIDDILNNNKSKSTRVQRGLYLDSDIDKVLNNLFKKGGKGSKSDILNSVLRKEFKRKGLLK